jgi:uncharacterized protein
MDDSSMGAPPCPWIIVQGEGDDVVDPAAVIGWANALDPKPLLILLPGVGHFFHGRLHDLQEALSDAIRSG